MFVHTRELTGEIAYYERQNFRLMIEDLLREIEGGERGSNQQKIKENRKRIERLYECLDECM